MIGKQPLDALAQRQRRSRRLGRDDEDRGLAVARASDAHRCRSERGRSRRRSRAAVPAALAPRTARFSPAGALPPQPGLWPRTGVACISTASAAPKIAAATAFAHKIRDPSVLQSHAGKEPNAWSMSWAAIRGSRNGANSDSTIGMQRNSLPNEVLIEPAVRPVHAAPPSPDLQGGITLIPRGRGQAR